MNDAKYAYRELQKLGVKNEDARYVLPNATQTQIVVSADFRELRHIFYIRGDKHSQFEIRNIALQMLRIMKKEAPSVFDFAIDEETMTAYTPFPS